MEHVIWRRKTVGWDVIVSALISLSLIRDIGHRRVTGYRGEEDRGSAQSDEAEDHGECTD